MGTCEHIKIAFLTLGCKLNYAETSTYERGFRAAGLEVTALLEPPATPDAPYTSDDWANHGGQLDRIPSTVILVGVRR